ncbi:spotted leaf 11 [Musa troglodytarum]|uniref:Spotted leaf 11 n=1 Tax=Musa troglodytarum TaxID=320322 RepID=A0A9E7FRH1_9LILI|nr:spotted leaf 11 [Musa troglodytarum]
MIVRWLQSGEACGHVMVVWVCFPSATMEIESGCGKATWWATRPCRPRNGVMAEDNCFHGIPSPVGEERSRGADVRTWEWRSSPSVKRGMPCVVRPSILFTDRLPPLFVYWTHTELHLDLRLDDGAVER